MLLGVSLDRVPQSGQMLWQLAALALRPSKSHSGLALLYVTELLPGCCGASAGRAGSAGPGWERSTRAPRGPAAENTAWHWHRTRDTGSPAQQKHGGAARRASGKPATQTLRLPVIYLDRILGIVAFCVAM